MGRFSSLDGRAHRMGMLDVDCLVEIKRTLRRFQFDPAFRGNGKRVPLRQFADLCGVSRQSIYDIVRGDRKGIEPSTRDRIVAAIALVNDGLRWKRITVRKAVVERRIIEPGLIEWIAVLPNGKAVPPLPQRHRTEARR